MSSTQQFLLEIDAIHVGLESVSRDEAIRFVGDQLVERGNAEPAYVDGMLEREETVSTFLGNGVAMPHGTFESKEAIKSTGIVVAQYPEGVDWGVGTAHIVIGLAAVGEEHVQILSHIAEVLQDEDEARVLWDTPDAALVLSSLNAAEGDDAVAATITITGEAGLHARPASMIVEYCKSFDGSITITKDGKSAKANSIMSVLALGAVTGDVVDVEIESDDEDAAQAALDEIERILTTSETEL